MTKQDAAALLVQLYADCSVLCSKYGYNPSNGTAEAVAMAVQALQGVEQCNSGELKEYWQWYE